MNEKDKLKLTADEWAQRLASGDGQGLIPVERAHELWVAGRIGGVDPAKRKRWRGSVFVRLVTEESKP